MRPRIPADLDRLLISDEIMADPYPIYARLRDEASVAWSEAWSSWVVSRYEDVNASLRDKINLSNEDRQRLLFADFSPDQMERTARLRHYFGQKDVIGADPPDHTRFRLIVQKAFTPKVIATLQPRIRDLAVAMVGQFVTQGGGDFIDQVAHPLPVIVIAEMLGAPPQDRAQFKRWSADILAFQGTGRTTIDRAMLSQAALVEMFDYMNDLIEDRQGRPRDDVISALALAEAEGGRLTRDELLATCNTMLSAGHETTTNLIGNLVRQLLLQPEHWAALRDNPSLIPGAIEESLRYDAPKQRNFRRVKVAHEFGGQIFNADEMVFQLIGSANRDPRRFADPDRFDIRREENAHLSFGSGIHFCLGAPLARLEAGIVLQTMLEMIPDATLDPTKPAEWQERVQFRGPKSLFIRRAAAKQDDKS